jgi:hypothetical protein
MADFDYKKFITEAKLNIKVPVKEMARIAKEKYKLNPNFPEIKDRIKTPSNYKTDRKQQVINYFLAQAKEQGIKPMDVELLKSDIEKNSAPGVNWSFTPDIRNQLLQATTVKPTSTSDDEEEGGYFGDYGDAEDMFVGKTKLKGRKAMDKGDDEGGPTEKDLAKLKLPKATPLNSKVGDFFNSYSGLIDKIIKKYATSTMKTGRVVKEAEDGGMSSADFKSANLKSKEAAKEALPELIQQLVDALKDLKSEDHVAYVKVLNDLDKYKFTPTNTKNVLKQLLKALDEPTLPAIGSKKKKSDDDELKALGIDDEPIELDGEEEI